MISVITSRNPGASHGTPPVPPKSVVRAAIGGYIVPGPSLSEGPARGTEFVSLQMLHRS